MEPVLFRLGRGSCASRVHADPSGGTWQPRHEHALDHMEIMDSAPVEQARPGACRLGTSFGPEGGLLPMKLDRPQIPASRAARVQSSRRRRRGRPASHRTAPAPRCPPRSRPGVGSTNFLLGHRPPGAGHRPRCRARARCAAMLIASRPSASAAAMAALSISARGTPASSGAAAESHLPVPASERSRRSTPRRLSSRDASSEHAVPGEGAGVAKSTMPGDAVVRCRVPRFPAEPRPASQSIFTTPSSCSFTAQFPPRRPSVPRTHPGQSRPSKQPDQRVTHSYTLPVWFHY